MIVDRNYRGCRIEVEAEPANGLWDAHVRIFRLRTPSELVHVKTIICQQPTAATAEEGSFIYARRWVERHSGGSRPKSVSVAFAVGMLCGFVAVAGAVTQLIRGDSLARSALTLLFGLVLLAAALRVGRGDSRAAWLTVALGVVAVLFVGNPTPLLLAFTLLATSLIAAVRLHAGRRTPSQQASKATTRIESMAAPLVSYWGWARVVIGASFSQIPVGVVVALGVVWLIGLVSAPFGAVGTIGVFVWFGLGLAGTVLLGVLFGRFIMWLLRKLGSG